MKYKKNNFIFILLGFLICCCFNNSIFAQNIFGPVNQYEAVGPVIGLNSITIPATSILNVNDTVLIIQMQGAEIDHSNSNAYGNIININNTGNFEFNIIDSINFSTHIAYFKCNLVNSYTGVIQIVRVHTFPNAVVTGAITVPTWNGSTGGIIAFFAPGTLTLNADIIANGRGFSGALPSHSITTPCSQTSLAYQGYYFPSNATDTAGFKGEGITIPNNNYSRGRGKNANGGGGGHTLDAAGGGGSGFGDGGYGGKESNFCSSQNDLGGLGGIALNNILTTTPKLILGGGGGAGLFNVDNTDATAGGNGGGIILIFTHQLIANGHTISANGASVTNVVTTNESAGGGGGGGIICISANTLIGTLNISATGGNGGSASTSSIYLRGSGGGGGGGLIQLNIPSVTGILPNTIGGNAGTAAGGYTGQGGGNGTMNNGFVSPGCVIMSTILNNNIAATVPSGCSGQTFSFTGSVPTGGNGNFTFLWEQSSDNISWVSCPGNNNSQIYSAILTSSTYFRRNVFSGSEASTSNVIQIIVDQLIISPSQVDPNCAGSCNGKAITSVTGTIGITYLWNDSQITPQINNLCDGVYTVTVTNTFTGCTATASYTIVSPPVMNVVITSSILPTCKYSANGTVTVLPTGGSPPYNVMWNDGTSGNTNSNLGVGNFLVNVTDLNGCIDTISFNLNSTVNISNNKIDSFNITCGITDTVFPIDGSIPDGVDSTVTFKWIETTDTLSNTWIDASILIVQNDGQKYIPPNPGLVVMYYSRIVYFNGCSDTSNICTVYVFPNSTTLSGNIISPSLQTVNYLQFPDTIIGNIITGGISGYTRKFIWFKSINTSFDPFLAVTESIDSTLKDLIFNEGAVSSFYYNRFSYFEIAPAKLACITFSNTARVQLLDSNVISNADTLLCSGTPSTIIYGNSSNNNTYQWEENTGSGWNPNGVTTVNFQPGTLTNTTGFRRKVLISGDTLISNVIRIHITPVISNNIIRTTTFSTTSITVANGTTANIGLNLPLGGNGSYTYLWRMSSDNSIFSNAPPVNDQDNYITPGIYDTKYFKRIVNSGSCSSVSNVLAIYPSTSNASATTPIETCGDTATLDATPVTNGIGWWTAPAAVTFITSDTLYNAQISIAPFNDFFKSYTLYWHVLYLSVEDIVEVTVNFIHTISPPNAGTDIYLTNVNSVQLHAANPPYGTGSWTVLSGGGIFANSGSSTTMANEIPIGESLYKWTVTNGPCTPLNDTLKIIVVNSSIPEGFSPNGDGLNDYFEVAGIDNYPSSELVVYNRWGIEVYRKKTYDNKWDGKSKAGNVLPEDTYFYILKFDSNETKKGYVVIKR